MAVYLICNRGPLFLHYFSYLFQFFSSSFVCMHRTCEQFTWNDNGPITISESNEWNIWYWALKMKLSFYLLFANEHCPPWSHSTMQRTRSFKAKRSRRQAKQFTYHLNTTIIFFFCFYLYFWVAASSKMISVHKPHSKRSTKRVRRTFAENAYFVKVFAFEIVFFSSVLFGRMLLIIKSMW